jgi:hypothetical protein
MEEDNQCSLGSEDQLIHSSKLTRSKQLVKIRKKRSYGNQRFLKKELIDPNDGKIWGKAKVSYLFKKDSNHDQILNDDSNLKTEVNLDALHSYKLIAVKCTGASPRSTNRKNVSYYCQNEEEDLQCKIGSKPQSSQSIILKKCKPLVKIRKKRSESVGRVKMSYLILNENIEPGEVCDIAEKMLEKYEAAKKALRDCRRTAINYLPPFLESDGEDEPLPIFQVSSKFLKTPSSGISDAEHAAGSGQRALPLNALSSNTNDRYLWRNPSHPDRSSNEGDGGNQDPKNWLAADVCFDPRRSTMHTT